MLTPEQKKAKLDFLRAQAALLEAGIDENELDQGAPPAAEPHWQPAQAEPPPAPEPQPDLPPPEPPPPPLPSPEDLHRKLLANMHGDLAGLEGKLDGLKDLLHRSLQKAEHDIGHAGFTQSFLKHAHVFLDEFIPWIARAL